MKHAIYTTAQAGRCPSKVQRSLLCLLLVSGAILAGATLAHGAEITTNGTGGGPWSDPATWRGKTVPAPGDDVIVQKYDVLVFDHANDDRPSCRKLQIDPKGVFAFKTGAGKLICSVSEGIESYGIIKLDGTKSASDHLELRLIGDTVERRRIRLNKEGGLLLYGRARLPDGRYNVVLSSISGTVAKEDLLGSVEADGVASINWQRAKITDIKLSAKKIDNTGAKPHERLNLVDNQFTGHSRVLCHTCDTPIIARNTFAYQGAKPIDEPAINLLYCPLAEIKGNTVHGGFQIGISIGFQSDSILIGNTVEKCTVGISGGYGIPNTMIKKCVLRGCEQGLRLEGGSGVVEETLIEGAATAYQHENAALQLTQVQIKDVAPKGTAVLFKAGTLTLLNCNITPAQITIAPQPATAKDDPVTCLQYAIIRVKDAPADALVEVRTAVPALPADASDPNVRNSPAPLVTGLTPLPRTLNPLILKAWSIDLKGKVVASPQYSVKVLGPSAKEGATRPLLKLMNFRPPEHAFRATLDDAAPTLEVSLK